ncbi:calcium-transporting P-type ATPase, PMR1-type [Heliorestis acidaminivorans]|uniref:P-type Ca(2+) transporter n=1 Tax=Heliorestis acidaminivorans TaxID=553427 RepID=A0A6I0F398_9FIRM|nr:calcium-transporting P-type ATPase, PMR1-type [Heliorestis acidaminivorans]KAB2954481.1 calcium-transporting P-type ATPase, PMR1-type [Heliorestis acidaminivorans]
MGRESPVDGKDKSQSLRDKPWHQFTTEKVLHYFESNQDNGLSEQAAKERLAYVGPNCLKKAESEPLWKKLLNQFQDFMILVLLGATLFSFFLGEIVDAVTILVIVVMNALLGFVQEYRAEKSLEALQKLTAPEAKVLRGGQVKKIAAEKVVPGDLVFLEAGDRVPADLRLLELSDLKVDEAALTGESIAVSKQIESIDASETSLGDRKNMAYAGTMVTQGRGQGLVVATAMDTEMGNIANLMESVGQDMTPLQRRLEHLGKVLVVLCLLICTLVVLIGLWQGEPIYRMLLVGVSLAVAAIPEGLPAIVTIALAIGVQKMIKNRAIIRKLPAVETLGCATVICSDKTGTLTQNEMTVREMFLPGQSDTIKVDGQGYEPIGAFRMHGEVLKNKVIIKDLLRAATICNNAVLKKPKGSLLPKKEGSWQIQGDPTEGALMVLSAKGGIYRENVEKEFERIREIPFDSNRKRMAVIVKNSYQRYFSYVKGAPEAILNLSSAVQRDGQTYSLSEEEKQSLLLESEKMGQKALRVIALAYRVLPHLDITDEDVASKAEENLIFLGFAGMMDPPRPGVQKAVQRCQRAGIKTVMITGDHPVTGLAIARELGIAKSSQEVIVGHQLDKMTDKELIERVEGTSVFARVSPVHKLRIVGAFKKQGQVVAMTGDGVNDAPAVKEADIGISMGRTGTDVTKEASSMVLADDNFVTIATAVQHGRTIYDNIRKFIRYLLSCNTGEVLVMFLASLMAMPLPLLPVQLLWVNLVTDGLPALALGLEKSEPDVMERSPRHPQESIFSRGLAQKILFWGAYCGVATLAVFSYGIYLGDLDLARTMAFCTLTFFQLFYVFDCRSEKYSIFELGWTSNPYLIGAVALSALMQIAVVYIPPLQLIFQTVPLEISHWLVILFMAGGWLLLAGIWHFLSRRNRLVHQSPVDLKK